MRLSITIGLLLLAAAACGQAGTPAPGEVRPYAGLQAQALGAYRAVLELQFEGPAPWRYSLQTRSDGQALEYQLHIEGVDAARNPGDVRLISEGADNWMTGPGAGGECLRFPSDLDLGPSFLTPDDLVLPQSLDGRLQAGQGEAAAGRPAAHDSLRQESLESWRGVQLDIWRDQDTGAVLRYDLSLAGADPLFDTGEGTLTGSYRVTEAGPQAIEPVTGCEIDLPLPADAARIVKLPGLVAFETNLPAGELAAFYGLALPQLGWLAEAPPESGGQATVLSFTRQAERLDINLEDAPSGTRAELLRGEE